MTGYTIIWDNEAINNLETILKYVAKRSVFFAGKVGNEILSSIEKLAANHTIGPEEESLKKYNLGHRYLAYAHYKIIYVVHGDKIFVSTIFDTRQKLPKAKKIMPSTNS
jgi:plasmid stabilization system protein ParE